MNKLTLKITGNNTFDYLATIDGKPIKFEKNEHGSKTSFYETDKDEVELHIKSYHELDSKVWFLTSTFFSLISVFGIFDTRYDKRGIDVDYTGKIKLNEFSNLNLAFNTFAPTNKLFEASGDCEIEDNESNRYKIKKSIKTHLKVVKWMRFLMWLSLVAIIVIAFTM